MQHLITPLLAAAVLVISTAPVQADLGDQLFKLLPDDGAADDIFASSVAISGSTAVIGAVFDDDNGTDSGSAYLFDTTTGRQIAKLLPGDGAPVDYFGSSVAIGSATAIVGAYFDDNNGAWSGSAYLFNATTGQQIAQLLPDDGAPFDHFGVSVAISGAPAKEVAIVGAYFDDDNGEDSGSAYLFDTTTGRQIAKLLPNDGAAGDLFGAAVAISGNTVVVGALFDDDNGSNSGSAYLFDVANPQNPVQTAKLVPDDGAAADLFGISVAICGSTVLVGAPRDDDNGLDSGSVYLFDTTTGRQIAKLLAPDGAPEDWFGVSVSLSGTTAIVGAERDDDNGNWSGSAYLFDTTTGEQLAKLLSDDGAAGDRFGISVAISGAIAIVGSPLDDDSGEDSGSAYLFDAAAPGTCPWDLDDNGIVGAADLLGLLVSWGPCQGCPADFDGNDNVGASDLLALLANWGPCS